jgi:hypothetical protein
MDNQLNDTDSGEPLVSFYFYVGVGRPIIKDVLEYNYKLEREVKYKMLMNFGNKSTNSSVVE